MSYWAGWPVPSSTSVNANVTEESVVLATARFDTVPGCTGLPAVTVTAAVPLCPSLVAVMVAVPVATPVTRPPVDTVAIAGALDAQLTIRPLSGLPFASSGVAVSWPHCPTWIPAVAGLTLTDATGTGFTVTAALPVLPSLVAVIVTAPAATPVTSPVEDTVATAGALDVQVTDRPESTLPAASFSVAVSCTVAPTSTTAVTGLITTDATGTFATVTLADPLLPSLVAVIVTAPAATPITRPLADTVAIAVFELVHVTARPASTFPAASLGVALSCVVAPTNTVAVAGLTVTDATGTLDTVTAAVPLCPSLVAVIVAAPTATPVDRKSAETVATALLLVVQVTIRPLSRLPLASLGVAVSCTVPPTYTFGPVGLTITDATGTFATVTAAVPLCPSLIAVIVAAPTVTPATTALAETVAIAGFELAHPTTRPPSTFPAASRADAL